MKRKQNKNNLKRLCCRCALPAILLASFAGTGVAHAEGTGWIREEGVYYFLDEEGEYRTGWLSDGGKWYYFGTKTGAMQTGWRKISGEWYYFNPKTGAMRTGWLQQGEKWYYFSQETGRMQTGWVLIGNKWFFFGSKTGAMQTGWVQDGENWYYLNPNSGARRTGWLSDKDNWYFFDLETGVMRTGWVTVGKNSFYFRAGGDMAKGWETVDGQRFYFLESGAVAKGWQTIDGKYYFKDSGAMAVGEILTIDGKRQGFSGSGDWLGEKTDAFLNAYAKALTFVEENTDASMSQEQKLRKCFELFRDTFYEKNPWIPHYTGMDWAEKYAYACLDTKSGNCFSYGAGFAFVARAIGYDNVYACSSGGHGWAEIDGKVYDPEWTKHAEGNYFGRPLKSGDSPNYLGAVTRTGDHWTYRKI